MSKIKVPTKDGYYDIHDSETGEFAPKTGELDSYSDDFLDLDDFVKDLEDEFIGTGDEIELETKKDKLKLTDEQDKLIEELGFGDVELALINSFDDLDKEKIISAPEDELRTLLKAKILLSKMEDIIAEDKELNDLKKDKFVGLWKDVKDASDYKELSETKSDGADFTRFESKRKYIENSTSPTKGERLDEINRFEELGKKYLERENKLRESFENLKKISEMYKDHSDIYSDERKNKAKIFSSGEEALEKIGPKFKNFLESLKKEDPAAYESLGFYTGSYSVIQEPLYGKTYWKSDASPFGFVKTVKAMTRALDKSTFDEDMRIERGTGHIHLSSGISLGPEMSISELRSYIGSEFKQQGFCSTSAVEDVAFDKGCMLDIYCPKGTKGAFLHDIARFDKNQYEILLQRGYSLKITDINKKGSKVYVKCDVILGSDEEKYSDSQLEEISRRYISG